MRNLILAFCLLCSVQLSAQSFEVGLGAGVSFYNGDIIPATFQGYLQTTHPAAGVYFRYNALKALSFRLGFVQARVSGDDASSIYSYRNLSFRSDISELYLVGEWRPFQMKGSSFIASPYLFGGINVYRFNPQAEFEGQWVDLQPLGTEGQGLPGYEEKYELVQYGVPLGLGIVLDFEGNWSFGFEFGARKLFTDYLDDIGGVTVLYDDILEGNGTLAAQLSNPNLDPEGSDSMISYFRGGFAEDWYYVAQVTLGYQFGQGTKDKRRNKWGKTKCPQF